MTQMMDALVKTEARPGLVLKQVPVPTVGLNEVLIKVHKTAICGTDVHIYNWNQWAQENVTVGITIGHEYVGEIAQIGEGVSGLKIGEKVSGEGHIVCGQCRNCRSGNGQWCTHTKGVGVQRNGAFAEYICIPASNVVKIREDADEEIVAFFDAFGNATHTALMFDVVGEDVLVAGAGPIGIMAAAIAKHNGARNVVVTDLNDYRLALAKKMGADVTINVGKEKVEDYFDRLKITEGFDVGMEMSGSAISLENMIASMRNGGKIALLGIQSKPATTSWNNIIFKGLTIQGVYGRKMFETWYKMQAMIDAGLDLKPLITHRYNYRDFEKGFEAMNSTNSGKVILDWGK